VFHKLYIDPSLDDPSKPAEQIDPTSIKGAVLMLDDQRMDRLLFEHSLQGTQVKVVTVDSCDEAIKRLQSESFDVFISDLNLLDTTGEQAFAKARTAGFKGALIALTAETLPRRIHAAQTAGAAAVIAKPYEVDRLLATLAAFLQDVGTTPDQLIHSTQPAKREFQPVLKQYVDNVKGMAVEIKHAVERNDFKTVRAHCQTLKGSAAGFGFSMISDIARDIGKVLDTSKSVAESATQIEHLLQICRRITAMPK
jgi:CheY-like chemotaxis protein